jgi:hypothetical protein
MNRGEHAIRVHAVVVTRLPAIRDAAVVGGSLERRGNKGIIAVVVGPNCCGHVSSKGEGGEECG